MYAETKTWNPFLGCKYDCIYCKPSFQATIARFTRLSGRDCDACLQYQPHEHPERLVRIPSARIIFVFGDGDITFTRPEFVGFTIQKIKECLLRGARKTFYFQSKNPACFNQYLDDLRPIEGQVVLVTTLETNRDEGYDLISKAPLPYKRFMDFLWLPWKRKIVTIEPVMNFDLELLVKMIREIRPEAVYLGYNSRPLKVQLPEPEPAKFWALQQALSQFTEVRLKETRGEGSA
jgi:hypothetical protein